MVLVDPRMAQSFRVPICQEVNDISTGVAVAPGVDFDTVDGGKYIRMCFAGDGDDITRAVEILGDWLARQSEAPA